MKLFDTHSHLDDLKFQNDFTEVLDRAAKAGLERITVVGTTAASSATCVSLASQHDILLATVGIQPNHVAEVRFKDWDKIVQLSEKDKVVALGETGLDRHWDFTPFDQQEDYFARHLQLSRQRKLPVVIHCREAEADTLRMLRDDYEANGPVNAVMHSFSGSLETALACLEMGLYISFAGMVTYKNAQNLRDVAKEVPRDRILIETDSPYLSPAPLRGKRNEPAFVAHTAECLANVLEMDLELFGEQTSNNARKFFGLAN